MIAEPTAQAYYVSLEELLTDSFVRRHTAFRTLERLLEVAGMDRIHDLPDAFVERNTRFFTWRDMKSAACAEWIAGCPLG